jgi:hypothetical protein
MKFRILRAILLLSVAAVAEAQSFSQEQIKRFELESQVKSDLYLAPKVLQDGKVELLQFSLSELQIASLSPQQMRLLRNAFFAKYGYKFRSPDLLEFFSKFSWYQPQIDEIPSSKLTKDEQFNVELLQSYEKDFAEPKETSLKQSDLVGMWHAMPIVASGYSERFFLYADGRFEYATNQMDGTKRIISIAGIWKLEGNSLLASISSERYQQGGTIVPPYASWGSRYVIDDATVRNINLTPPLQMRFPLSHYNAKDDLEGKLPDPLPYLVIGAREFWKMYENPDQGRD